MLDLSVVIVNYNVREFLEQALRSVERAGAGLDVEVFVVDNNSVDGSVAMVREQFPGVHVIANEANVGFGPANNQAIRRASGRYLLILNPDTLLQENTLRTLVRFMEGHPDAGAVGCQIVNPDGTFAPESRRAFPTPEVAFYRLSGLSRLFPKHPRFGRYNMTYLPVDEVAEVDALSGSCMMVRRAVLYAAREEWTSEGMDERTNEDETGRSTTCNVSTAAPATGAPPLHSSTRPLLHSKESRGAGLFDEDFFMYGEDLDWCFRIQQAGWKIFYTPDTQIVHYKGESTKKGDMRYVRLFYGAMLQFTEKHFQGRYSRLMAWMLRAGIVMRGALSLVSQSVYRLARPALDALLVAAVVLAVSLGYGAVQGVSLFTPAFLASVVPALVLSTVAGVALAGGYRRTRTTRLRPVGVGALAGFVLVATLSYFVKDIAFSRAVVALSPPAAAFVLSGQRLLLRLRRQGPRRAAVVGRPDEARRLQQMLAAHPRPPLDLAGYVDDGTGPAADGDALPRLGSLHQLRDLVRLRHLDEVVFAAEDVSNRTVLRIMQQLRDLPVRFTILAEGRSHVIGKASIEDLATPTLVEAEDAVGTPRSTAARRAFELPVALIGTLLHPLVLLGARIAGHDSFLERLGGCTRHLPAVLAGRRALVGYDPAEPFHPPAEWNVWPGAVAVTDALAAPPADAEHATNVYWHYATHQSVALDCSILVRALRHPRP